MQSPTARTLQLMRKQGYTAEVVERFNSFTKQRKDLLGFIDLIAIGDGETIGVQTTSQSNVSARVRKITKDCADNAAAWLRAGNKILVIGWAKRGKRGKAKRWQHSQTAVTMNDLSRSRKTSTFLEEKSLMFKASDFGARLNIKPL